MTRNIKVSDMGNLSKKLMTAKILEKRDKVAQQAKLSGNSSLVTWQSTAPIRTGRMRNSLILESNKSTTTLIGFDSYMKVINSVNKYGKHRGFRNRFQVKQGRSFLQKF